MSLYTHTLRVLPIHFGRETVPSALYYVGLRQENWETRCGYVYETCDNQTQCCSAVVCSAYTPVYAGPTLKQHCLSCVCWVDNRLMCVRPDEQHNIDYRCSADPMRFIVGPASATSDQYCIGIGSTHRGCGITILMVTEYHPSLSSFAVGCSCRPRLYMYR